MITEAILRMHLRPFIVESNGIEGIADLPSTQQIVAAEMFLQLPKITIPDLVTFVNEIQPNAVLRDKSTLNVRVGNYIAPGGGMSLVGRLGSLLTDVSNNNINPWKGHTQYEMLHPFTDGNGRSGRLLWVWHMIRDGKDPFLLRFLHRAYYQALENSR